MVKSTVKRILSLALSAVIALGVFVPGTEIFASAAEVASGTCGKNLTWTLDSEGLLTISGEGKMEDYYSCMEGPWPTSSVISVEIEYGVTSVGAYAFCDCISLTSITIPESVLEIGYYSFARCDNLERVNIPNGVKYISDDAFYFCTNLTSITIPNSVIWIGLHAFYKCEGLNKVNYFGTVDQWISIYFADNFSNPTCYAKKLYINDELLTKVILGEEIECISDYAFQNCADLVEVTIGNNVNSIGSEAFSGCTNLTNIIIPNSVVEICRGAFFDCTGLTNIIIPDNVTSLWSNAFRNCSSLTSVTIGNGVKDIGTCTFEGCSKLTNVSIPDGMNSIGYHAFYGCSHLTNITIPSSVTSIDGTAFCNVTNICYDIEKMNAQGSPWGAKYVNKYCEDYIVYDSPKKEKALYCIKDVNGEIVIPDSVTSIGESAFESCTGITNVIIPEGVTSIDRQAFSRCSGLTSVNIPDSVISIGSGAFLRVPNICYDTEKMKATGSPWGAKYVNKYYEDNIIYDTSEKKVILYCAKNAEGEIIIPNTVTEIKASAFADCLNLTNVIIPNSVQKIGKDAFKNVMNITYDPEKMLAEGSPWGAKSTTAYTEGNFVYYDNSKAMLIGCLDSESQSITVPDCVEAIDGYAFTLCDNLQTLSFSSPQIVFSPETLVGCSSVRKVSSANTDNGITYTDYNPASSAKGGEVHLTGDNGILFADRTMSGTYTVPDTVSFICPSAFATCIGLEVSIPDSVTLISIGKDAFLNSKNFLNWSEAEAFQVGNYLIKAAENIKSYQIPANIICIADGAFDGCLELLTVSSLGRRLLSVGKSCFRGCSKLKTVTIPDTVRYLGSGAFEDTPITKTAASDVITVGNTLVSVPLSTRQYVVPDNITCIADGAFRGCELMTSVTLPESIISIGEECFAGCLTLREITIPESVTAIGKNAFKDCASLTEINIPEKVGRIDYTSFYGCTGINTFTVDEDNARFAAEDGILMSKDKTELMQYPASKQGEEYTIPLNVKYIESFAFRKCSNLKYINIPRDMKYGYKNPFEGCKLETALYDEGGSDDYSNTVYYIDGGDWELVAVTSIGPDGRYVVNENVSKIGANAFAGITELKEIVFNDKLSVIGEEAFMGCTGLTEVNIPAGVTRIEKSAFEGCKNLKTVTFGTYNGYENEALESVGEYAFANTAATGTENVFGPDDTRYNKLFVETDAFHQHTPGEPEIVVVDDSTCDKEGLQRVIIHCTDEKCGKEISNVTQTIDKKPHTPKAPVIENATASSCSVEGEYDEVTYCAVCGTEISREHKHTQKDEHTPQAPVYENTVNPSCTENGSREKVVYCGICHQEISRTAETIPALGHSFTNYVYNDDATAEHDGTETAKCDRCDETHTGTAVGTALPVLAIHNMAAYNGKTVAYKTTITFTADIKNCTGLEWYVNGKKTAANPDGSCTVTEATGDIEIYCTAKDSNGQTIKSETEKITVKHGFFDKLIAFFKGLFKKLPVISQ